MIINFNFTFKGLDGKEVKGTENGERTLAALLANMNKGNSVKLFDWALKLYNGKSLDLDATDVEVLVGLIEGADNLTNLAKAQLLNAIQDAKDKAKK